MSALIENRSSLSVRGGDFPIDPTRRTVAKYLSYAQIGLIGLLIAGSDNLLPAYVRDNKWTVGIFVWFLGNAFSSFLTNTGAFEIYVGETLVWSTLKEGALPNYMQLLEAFRAVGVDLGGKT